MVNIFVFGKEKKLDRPIKNQIPQNYLNAVSVKFVAQYCFFNAFKIVNYLFDYLQGPVTTLTTLIGQTKKTS